MDKKRILVYTESYLPSIGGLENNTLLLCQTLQGFGHQVTLLTPQKNAIKNINFNVVENRKFEVYIKAIKNKDIILVNGGVSFKIIIPCLLLKKPYIVIYQMASLFNNTHINNFKTKISNQIRKLLATRAKLNVGVSRYSYRELKRIFGEDKSALLTNPADPMFQNQLPNTKNTNNFECLFAGRLIEGKGIKLLVTAIKTLRMEGLNFNLHIVGDGPEKEWIKNKLDLGYIFLYPPAKPEELKDWYNKVRLTIIPSTTHIEGSPLVMAESLSSNTPVLASNQPAMVDSLKQENMTFISGDLNDLILKLRVLLNPIEYEQVFNHTKNLAKEYHYDNYIYHLQKIINV